MNKINKDTYSDIVPVKPMLPIFIARGRPRNSGIDWSMDDIVPKTNLEMIYAKIETDLEKEERAEDEWEKRLLRMVKIFNRNKYKTKR